MTILYLFGLQDAGRIDYGGTAGFWAFTVTELTGFLFYPGYKAIRVVIALLSVIMLVLFAFSFLRKRDLTLARRLLQPDLLFFYLLAGNILASHAEHLLFGILYPDARASITLVILFTGALVFLLDGSMLKPAWKVAVLLPFIFLPVHFARSVNLHFSESDTYNYNIPQRFYDTIASAYHTGDYPPTVQGYQLRTMRWNFMNFLEEKELGILHFSSYPSLLGDFQVVVPEEYPAWLDQYSVIDRAKDSPLALMKRTKNLTRTPLLTRKIAGSNKDNTLYRELLVAGLDTLAGASLYLGFRINALSEASPFHAWIVAEVRDRDDKASRYEYLPLDWFRTRWDDPDSTFINGLLIEDLPADAKSLKCYLWNIDETGHELGPCTLDLFLLSESLPARSK
jgi:hypothetical protein